MTQHMAREPHEGIKADTDPETPALEHDQSSYVARRGQSSGTVDSGATASDGPLAGVTAHADEVRNAVSGDIGPTRPRRQ